MKKSHYNIISSDEVFSSLEWYKISNKLSVSPLMHTESECLSFSSALWPKINVFHTTWGLFFSIHLICYFKMCAAVVFAVRIGIKMFPKNLNKAKSERASIITFRINWISPLYYFAMRSGTTLAVTAKRKNRISY